MKASLKFNNEKQDDKQLQKQWKKDTMIYEVSWIPPAQQKYIYN